MTADEAIAEVRYMIPTANITSRQAEALAKLVGEVERLRMVLKSLAADRDYWHGLCREAIHEGQRAQRIAKEWQDIAEGAG